MNDSSAQNAARSLVDLGLVRPQEASDALDALGNGTVKDLIAYFERKLILTPFQIQKFEAGETTGYFCGRFKLQYQIAAGTFARVFRAVDITSGECVAVKILRGRHTTDPENIRQFHREGKLTEQLRHPNIARTLEVGTDQAVGRHYIAMEFIEGGNLREFIRIRKKIEPKELIRLAMQMVAGLRYALSQGLTHRDIKPTNILISAAGDVKWVDFGLGGVVEKDTSASQAAQRTIDYAGLEKATGAPKGDFRSDIFFLGVVFYELLTGEHPLGGRDRGARALRVRFDSIPRLSDREEFPADLTAVIDKMLAYRPEQRYQDYDSISTDLNRASLGSPVPVGAAASAGPPRVAIVHHSPKVQEILKGKLGRRGFQTILTTDLTRAAVLCRIRPADCVIIDLDTTGRAGIEQFRSMKRSGAARSAIFLTSSGQENWLAGMDSDSTIQLNKPLILGPVYQAVRALVGRMNETVESGVPDQDGRVD